MSYHANQYGKNFEPEKKNDGDRCSGTYPWPDCDREPVFRCICCRQLNCERCMEEHECQCDLCDYVEDEA